MSTLTLGGVALPSLPPEGAEMAGVPAADRQALAAVPQAAPAAGGILVDQPRVLARPTLPGTPGGRRPLRAVPRGPVRPPTGGRPVPAGQRAARLGRRPRGPHPDGALPAAPPATRACGSSRCCCPPTPSRTGPS